MAFCLYSLYYILTLEGEKNPVNTTIHQKVSDFIDAERKIWCLNKLRDHFNQHQVDQIAQQPFSFLVWSKSNTGEYKVASGYNFLIQQSQVNNFSTPAGCRILLGRHFGSWKFWKGCYIQDGDLSTDWGHSKQASYTWHILLSILSRGAWNKQLIIFLPLARGQRLASLEYFGIILWFCRFLKSLLPHYSEAACRCLIVIDQI